LPTLRLQKCASLLIIRKLLLMLPAIKLDHYFLLNAREIGDVFSNWVLTAKSMTRKLLAAHSPPEHTLGIGHGTA
jgi:hypothetical protein